MNNKKISLNYILCLLHAVLMIGALVLSVVSSGRAYAVTAIGTLAVCGIAAVILDIIVIALDFKGFSLIRDIILWVSTAFSMYLMCGMIRGRLKLMGYVWFSDLESGNPVAVSALNLTVAAWVCVVLGIICLCIRGFKQEN